MAGRRPPTRTPYGKKIKPKKFAPKPLAPSPYLWVLVPVESYKAAFNKEGARGVRSLVLRLINAGSVVKDKYFAALLGSDVPPDSVIIRGDTRNRNLDVIGRTLHCGTYLSHKKELDISKRIEEE